MTTTIRQKKPKLLIVSEEPGLKSAVRTHMLQRGWDVVHADNYRKAVERYIGELPDVFLMDTFVDHQSGLGLAKALNSAGVTRHTLLGLIQRQMISASEAKQLREVKSDFILPYPVEPDVVEAHLVAALRRRAGIKDGPVRRDTHIMPNPAESEAAMDELNGLFDQLRRDQERFRDGESGSLRKLQKLADSGSKSVIKGISPGLADGSDDPSRIKEGGPGGVAEELRRLQQRQSAMREQGQQREAARPGQAPVHKPQMRREGIDQEFRRSRRRESEFLKLAKKGKAEDTGIREISKVQESMAERLARAKEQVRLKEIQSELRRKARKTGRTQDGPDQSAFDAELAELQRQLETLEKPGGLRELHGDALEIDPKGQLSLRERLDAASDEIAEKEAAKGARREAARREAEAQGQLSDLIDSNDLAGFGDLRDLGDDLTDLGELGELGDISGLGELGDLGDFSQEEKEAAADQQGPASGEFTFENFETSDDAWAQDLRDRMAALEHQAQHGNELQRSFANDQLETLRASLAEPQSSATDREAMRTAAAKKIADAEAKARFLHLERALQGAADEAEERLVHHEGPSDIQLNRLRSSLLSIAGDAISPMGELGKATGNLSELERRAVRRAGSADDERFQNISDQVKRLAWETDDIPRDERSGPTDIQLMRLQMQLADLATMSGEAAQGAKHKFEPAGPGYMEERLARASEEIRRKREERAARRAARRDERAARISDQLQKRLARRTERQQQRAARLKSSGRGFVDQQSFVDRVDETWQLPTSANELISCIEQFRTEPEDIAAAMDSDQELVDRLLAFLNSPLYDQRHNFQSLEEAVEGVGVEVLSDLVTGAEAFDILAGEQGVGRLDHRVLWLHSVGVAMLSMRLARLADSDTRPETLFTAGLLHDMGKVMLDELAHEDYERVIERAHREHLDLFEAENVLFETNHSRIARAVMSRWRLPRRMYQAVACHHLKLMSFQSDALIDRQGSAIVVIANRWMHARGWGDGAKDRQPPIESGWFEYAGIDPDAARRIFDNFEPDMRSALAFLDITGFLAAWQKPEYLTKGRNVLVVRSPSIAICTIEEGLALFADAGPHSGSIATLDEDLADSQADTVLLYVAGLAPEEIERALLSVAASDSVRRLIVVADPFQEEVSNPGVADYLWRIEAAGYDDLLSDEIGGPQIEVAAPVDAPSAMDLDPENLDIDFDALDLDA